MNYWIRSPLTVLRKRIIEFKQNFNNSQRKRPGTKLPLVIDSNGETEESTLPEYNE